MPSPTMTASSTPTRVDSSSPASDRAYPPSTIQPVSSYTLRKRPWRVYVVPFENILNHKYSGSGTNEDPYIVDWLPEDAEDPQRWNSVYKWTNIAIASISTLAVALSSSAYSGGIESLMRDFGASAELLTAGISLFVVGFAFGPLIWAPLSEVYGRRIIYIISYALMTLWTGVTIASPNVASVLVFRGLTGFFGSSPLANAGGTVSDVLDANQRGLGMAIFAAAPFLGPALGPITGGFLGLTSGWRWLLGFLTIFCGSVCLLLLFFSPETYAPRLLRERATTLSNATGKVYRFRGDAKQAIQLSQVLKVSLSRPWKFLILEPIVLILTIYTAIIYGILYLNFAAYPIVFQKGRGWNTGIGGLAFLGILVGSLIAVAISIFYINPQYIKVAKSKGGRADPEDRLPPSIWAGLLIVVGLAGFAATDSPNIHWIAPIIFGIPFGVGVIIVFLSVLGYLIDSYTIYAASVLAANSVLRSLFGAAFPLFTTYMYKALGIHWAVALPGFFALACVPFTIIFYKYGAKIQAKCKYAADAERQLNAMIAARMAAAAKKDPESAVESDGTSNGEHKSGPPPAAQLDGDGDATAEENEKANDASPMHEPQPNDTQKSQEWDEYHILAERDEVDLEDDERMRLYELHRKHDYALAKPKPEPQTDDHVVLKRASGIQLGAPIE